MTAPHHPVFFERARPESIRPAPAPIARLNAYQRGYVAGWRHGLVPGVVAGVFAGVALAVGMLYLGTVWVG